MPVGTNVPLGIMFCLVCNRAMTQDQQGSYDGACANCEDMHMAECESCGLLSFGDFDIMSMAMNARRRQHLSATVLPYGVVRYRQEADAYACDGCVHSCSECGTEWLTEESAWDCCPAPDYDSGPIRNYMYKPTPIFYDIREDKENSPTQRSAWSHTPTPMKLYMGVEIEVERAADYAADFLDAAGESVSEDPEFVYLKSDGSLSSDGVEIVTMPATLESFEEMFPFNATNMLRENGARAWAYTNCGYHVHVSRSAFTASHLWKFVKWQSENWQVCQSFAGRDSQQWASWHNEQMNVCKTRTSVAVKSRGYHDWSNRYSAINLSNRATVELRYFRPNLNRDGILRVVQFVQAIYDYTNQMRFADIVANRYDPELMVEFMEDKPRYELALQYIKNNNII